MDAPKETRAEAVRNQMRDDILNGTLKPGERLMFPDLCKRYDASVGVTRESLAGLVSQGLVRASAHRGFVVTPISRDELHDLVNARLLVETMVVEMSVSNGGIEWEASIVAAHHVMTRAYDQGPRQTGTPDAAWANAHNAFHAALFAACGNSKLLEITALLGESAALYRRWSDSLSSEPRDVIAEHKELLDAALAGDGPGAADLLRKHIERTEQALIDYTEDDRG